MKITSNHLINRIIRRLGLAMAVLLLGSATMTAMAQSTDRDNPAPLMANEIADEFNQNDPELFYQFIAGPGAVNFTLDLRARNYGGAFYVTLFDSRNHEMAAFDGLVSKGQTARVTKHVEFVKATPVRMRLYSGNGQGSYRLRLDGQVSISQIDASTQVLATAPQPAPNGQVTVGAPITGGASTGTVGQPAGQSAPSTDRDNPTPLDSNDIADDFHQDDPEYFYGFIAGPGTLTFTLELQARNYGGALYVTLLNEQGRELAAFDGVVLKGESRRVIKQVSFAKEMVIIMRLYSGNGQGSYHLHITENSARPAGSQLSQMGALPDGSQPATTSTDSSNPPSAQAAQPQVAAGSVHTLSLRHAPAVRIIFRRLIKR